MRNLHRSTAAAALGLAAALALSACSAGSATSSSTTAATSKKPFIIATSAVTSTMSFDTYAGIAQGSAFDPVKGPLLAYTDSDKIKAGETNSPQDVEPWLATKYKVTPTGIEFTLGDAVSSYGNKLTPADVEYTFKRIYGNKNSVAQFLAKIAGIDATNPVTITGAKTFTINATTNYLSLFAFSTYFLSPVDQIEIEKHATADDPWANAWTASHSAMFGAYAVSSFTPSKEIRYTANTNYTKQKLAYKTVVEQAVPETTGRISLVQTQQANMIDGIPFDTLKVLQKSKSLHVEQVSGGTQDVLDLNNTTITDPRIRQAISYAIDRTALLKGAYQGFGKASTSIVSSVVKNTGGTMATAKYNPTKAKALLAAAGATGMTLSISTTQAEISNVSVDALLTALKQQLAVVGINVVANNVASDADYFAGFKAGKYEASIRAEGPLAADPTYLLNLYYAKGGGSNYDGIDNATLNAAITSSTNLTGTARSDAIATGIKAANAAQLSVPLIETVSGYVYSKSTCTGTYNRTFSYSPQTATVCK